MHGALKISSPVSTHITAAEAACALGSTLAACKDAVTQRRHGLRPLRELVSVPGLEELLAGWIPDRSLLLGRRYGVATNAALHVARRAVAQAGWSAEELSDAWIFAGTSRGNAAESFGHTSFRRPVPRFSASNSLPSEIPSALSIELNIRGPWQLLSNACAAGLDALGMAHLAVVSGAAPRALVVAVELPLIPELLTSFQQSGLLSRNNLNAPYHSETNGLQPAEAVAALTLEPPGRPAKAALLGYWASSDAYHALAVPADGRGLRAAWKQALSELPDLPWGGICPHATGTAEQGRAEQRVLQDFLTGAHAQTPLALLKPFTGHSLGASGLLEIAILSEFLQQGEFPGATGLTRVARDQLIFKMASGMGGHNAIVALQAL